MKMSNRQYSDSTLCGEFIQIAKSVVSKFPDLKHSWEISTDKTSCSLNFPKQNDVGFDVLVKVLPDGITVLGEGVHQHFDSDESSNESEITEALALVRDLLSPHMRIREFRAGKSAYRWNMETFRDNEWHRECTTTLLFWNYFGRRSEVIFQNKTLPGRSN
ncbi:MAG TPA: hypothetical protein VH255_04945 [Verrucomicrobiae bacterium]|nr:hypothetical protein [Verrucomicrobiae bacterium]